MKLSAFHTSEEMIKDLKAIQKEYTEKDGSYPVCIDYAINSLEQQSQIHGKVLYSGMIPLQPRSKKNSMRILYKKDGTPFIRQSDQYLTYEKDSAWFLRKIPKPISEPVNIRAVFYRENEIKCDLTNLLEALDDILVACGIIVDDNWKVLRGHDGSTVVLDKKRPRTEFYIERWLP